MNRTIIRAWAVGVCLFGAMGVQAQQPTKEQAPAPLATASTNAASLPVPHMWLDPDGKPLPFKTDEEVMDFLRTAKVVKMKDIPTGIAHPRKVLLEKDGIHANAKFSSIHEQKDSVTLASGQHELGFRDDAIFDCAAQEMAKLLGMDNLPPVVERSVNGEKGILQIWVENTMTEMDRQKGKIAPPEPRRWNDQIQVMRFFDNLVYNTDRNAGNILIDKQWKVWLIDHTRAFRKHDDLLNAGAMFIIDRGIWEKLVALDEQMARDRLKPYLTRYEIDGLLNRRKKIIEHFRGEITKRGESDVLHDVK